jgi:hypothetical protein
VTAIHAAVGVPIVIGVETKGVSVVADSYNLRPFLESEFRLYRERYAHSPFLVLARAASELSPSISAAAAACGMPVVGCGAASNAQGLPELRHSCHVLISIASTHVLAAEETGTTAPPGNPAALAATALLSDEISYFEIGSPPEMIQLVLGGAPSYAVSRDRALGANGNVPTGRTLCELAMQRTDEFNHNAAVSTNDRPLEPAPHVEPNWPRSWASNERHATLRALYAVADRLALSLQRKFKIAVKLIFWLATTAAALYGSFLVFASDDMPLQQLLLVPYLLLLILAYVVFYLARRSDIHNRFVEYRALAEGLRVQCYWDACGINQSAADYYSNRYPVDLNWIRLAIRSATLIRPVVPDATWPRDPVDEVLRDWIADQQRYYAQAHSHALRVEKTTNIAVRVIFGLGGCATLAVLLQSQMRQIAPFLRHISFLGFLCSSIAAALVALVNKLGVLYQSQDYARMLAIYAQARRHLENSSAGSAISIAAALGRAALSESGEWILFRRERRIDEPASPFRKPW